METDRLAELDDSPLPHRRADAGATFIELLIAIVLMGTAIVAVVTAAQVAIIGSRLERDHARAHQWLQSAIGALQETSRAACDETNTVDGDEPSVRATYTSVIQNSTNVTPPPGWDATQIVVAPRVEIWDGEQYWDPTVAPQTCFDSSGHFLQLVTIEVRNPDGAIIESVEVVKDA